MDCFTVQVYKECQKDVQDQIVEALMKFINFQLLLTNSECTLMSEDAADMRRVLSLNPNYKDLKSLSFVNNAHTAPSEQYPEQIVLSAGEVNVDLTDNIDSDYGNIENDSDYEEPVFEIASPSSRSNICSALINFDSVLLTTVIFFQIV